MRTPPPQSTWILPPSPPKACVNNLESYRISFVPVRIGLSFSGTVTDFAAMEGTPLAAGTAILDKTLPIVPRPKYASKKKTAPSSASSGHLPLTDESLETSLEFIIDSANADGELDESSDPVTIADITGDGMGGDDDDLEVPVL